MASTSVTFSSNGVRGSIQEDSNGFAIIDKVLLRGKDPSRFKFSFQCDPGDASSCSLYVLGPSGEFTKWNNFDMPNVGAGERHTGIMIVPIGFDGYRAQFNRTAEPESPCTLYFKSM